MPATCTRTPRAGSMPVELSVEVRRARDEAARDDAVGEDLTRAVDVGEEPFEREHALADAGLDDRPFLRRDDAGHEVERERPLGPRQREGDALVAEGPVASIAAALEVLAGQPAQRSEQCFVVLAELAGCGEHLVPGRQWFVALEQIDHWHH